MGFGATEFSILSVWWWSKFRVEAGRSGEVLFAGRNRGLGFLLERAEIETPLASPLAAL